MCKLSLKSYLASIMINNEYGYETSIAISISFTAYTVKIIDNAEGRNLFIVDCKIEEKPIPVLPNTP